MGSKKLCLNETNTEIIIFRHLWKHLPSEPDIRINNKYNHIKYLGILIGEVLSKWNQQMDDICTKLAGLNGILSKLLILYLKKHHVLCGCLVWYYSAQRNID